MDHHLKNIDTGKLTPPGVTVIDPLFTPEHDVGVVVIVAVTPVPCVKVIVVEPVQPIASVTLIVYVPAASPLNTLLD
jgi:hypothetical protein